jgi:hypothetical protein
LALSLQSGKGSHASLSAFVPWINTTSGRTTVTVSTAVKSAA